MRCLNCERLLDLGNDLKIVHKVPDDKCNPDLRCDGCKEKLVGAVEFVRSDAPDPTEPGEYVVDAYHPVCLTPLLACILCPHTAKCEFAWDTANKGRTMEDCVLTGKVHANRRTAPPK